MSDKPIFVTEPYLPDLDELLPYLDKIWSNKILTNGGPLHQELEEKLCEYLGVNYLSLFANGTLALITALQALDLSGEVITTPYSFVATSHSLLWNNVKPIFVDIDEGTFNIDPNKIEQAITPQTTAILAVHCYGYPCAVEQIQDIAKSYGLRVIYDAAHAFGVRDRGGSILRHGDMSVLSFHATKVFNTFEGGAVICPDAKTKQKVDCLKNFGISDEVTVVEQGINGKMNEFQAAMGLVQLKYVDNVIARRKELDELYRRSLNLVEGITIPQKPIVEQFNYSYFPILVEENYPLSRDDLYEELKSHGIMSRRYFYPLITDFPMYRSLPSAKAVDLSVAYGCAMRILCLPIYPTLTNQMAYKVADIIGSV